MSNWKDMVDQRGKGEAHQPAPEHLEVAAEPELITSPDPDRYQPWVLQRGRGRPALFLDLRRFEPKTSVLIGCQMSYPHLMAIEYIGDHMVSLDFGSRHFVIEGIGLAELPQWLQQGIVLAIQEYAPSIWATVPAAPIVTRIVQINESANQDK